MLEILQSRIVISKTAFGDAPVMISGSEYGIKTYRTVKVPLGSTKVTEIILRYAAEEECTVSCAIE